MRWPWQRSERGSTAHDAVRSSHDLAAPRDPSGVAPSGWAFLPPLQRTIGRQPLVSGVDTARFGLSAWGDPSFMHEMTHLVDSGASAGVVDGDGTGTGYPELSSRTPELTLGPFDRGTGVGSSRTRAPGMPVPSAGAVPQVQRHATSQAPVGPDPQTTDPSDPWLNRPDAHAPTPSASESVRTSGLLSAPSVDLPVRHVTVARAPDETAPVRTDRAGEASSTAQPSSTPPPDGLSADLSASAHAPVPALTGHDDPEVIAAEPSGARSVTLPVNAVQRAGTPLSRSSAQVAPAAPDTPRRLGLGAPLPPTVQRVVHDALAGNRAQHAAQPDPGLVPSVRSPDVSVQSLGPTVRDGAAPHTESTLGLPPSAATEPEPPAPPTLQRVDVQVEHGSTAPQPGPTRVDRMAHPLVGQRPPTVSRTSADDRARVDLPRAVTPTAVASTSTDQTDRSDATSPEPEGPGDVAMPDSPTPLDDAVDTARADATPPTPLDDVDRPLLPGAAGEVGVARVGLTNHDDSPGEAPGGASWSSGPAELPVASRAVADERTVWHTDGEPSVAAGPGSPSDSHTAHAVRTSIAAATPAGHGDRDPAHARAESLAPLQRGTLALLRPTERDPEPAAPLLGLGLGLGSLADSPGAHLAVRRTAAFDLTPAASAHLARERPTTTTTALNAQRSTATSAHAASATEATRSTVVTARSDPPSGDARPPGTDAAVQRVPVHEAWADPLGRSEDHPAHDLALAGFAVARNLAAVTRQSLADGSAASTPHALPAARASGPSIQRAPEAATATLDEIQPPEAAASASGEPAVQRVASPASPVPAPGGAPTPAAGASAGAPTSPEQLDELARRLVGPLTRQIKAEMLIDRERRGQRTDAR